MGNAEYCQPQNASAWQFFGGQPCGFSDYHPPAYSPSDMKIFLERYAQHGEAWKPPDFHSGYNEVIVSSSDMNKHLPRAVEAFFVLDESHADGDRTGNLGINVRRTERVHRQVQAGADRGAAAPDGPLQLGRAVFRAGRELVASNRHWPRQECWRPSVGGPAGKKGEDVLLIIGKES